MDPLRPDERPEEELVEMPKLVVKEFIETLIDELANGAVLSVPPLL